MAERISITFGREIEGLEEAIFCLSRLKANQTIYESAAKRICPKPIKELLFRKSAKKRRSFV